MDNNEINEMLVRLSELKEWVNTNKVCFDKPGLVIVVDLDSTVAHVNTDAMESNDRRKCKLELLHPGLAHLACEVMRGNPKAVGVVAEWAERFYYEKEKGGVLERLLAAQGADTDDEQEGGAE